MSGKPPLALRLGILAGVLVTLLALPILALIWMTSVPGRSWEGPLPPISVAEAELAGRLQSHVVAIASIPHNLGHPEALERAARSLEASLAGAGYDVRAQHFLDDDPPVRNLEAVIEAASAGAPTLVIGAHYDSFGNSPGANDNGTGAAAVVELARALADLRGRSRLRLRFVLFANEEPPFFKTERMGSLAYARALKRSAELVLGMVSLETLGFYSDSPHSQHYPPPLGLFYPHTGNFVAFVGTTGSRSFVRRAVGAFREEARFPSVGGTAPGFVQGIDWSDHWSFERQGWPALMVTDTAPFRYPHYHSADDSPERLDYRRLARVVAGLERVVRRWALAGGN